MKNKTEDFLINYVRENIKNDCSHDFSHALRCLNLCKKIAKKEKADLDILIPAALFHDIICYPKDSPKSKLSAIDSAKKAKEVLVSISEYPKEKINEAALCIENCSFSSKKKPHSIESAILQDADRIEATGAIAIMRTFASAGSMNKAFYNTNDPFCENRKPESLAYAVDLFYERLLVVADLMNTKTAKKIAQKRTKILQSFLTAAKEEINE
ncbi:MAG: HD domain-containing protein [Lactobacillaceae bacterium]|jgi:uncharacterized protein|nr:HD domain-containing protein [Lactobacillaceae bacterium]